MSRTYDIKTYLIALNQIDKVGDKRISELINHYESVENIFDDKEENIRELLEKKFKSQIGNFDKNEILDKANTIVEKSKNYGIGILSLFDEDYPFNLKQIDNPPYILYYKGDLKKLRRNAIAIVGTREPTNESRKYSFELASKLSSLNISVVSGMAKGVDREAHLGAISSHINTVAVLGNGIDNVYPSENLQIYNKLSEKGLIVSEFEIGRKPDRMNFPRRNRIISGLSYAVVMVEAASKSGALITVDYALNQGRDVYIAPYDEKKSCYFGNHKLYKDGAKIAYNYMDILEDFDSIFSNDDDYVKMKLKYFEGGDIKSKSLKNDSIKSENNNSNNKDKKETKKEEVKDKKEKKKNKISKQNDESIISALQEDEALLYNIIKQNDKIHIDEVIEESKMKVQAVTSMLMQLEIKGIIKQLSGKYYTIEK
ncbi:DNA-processing protein DprA [Brachyspira hyodysenteriae]|uniref:DNA-processing protein DprA n=1 Tax=Brachyspira hyodysenteriae TaxID=159 RepID=UPI0002F8035B|nr:DNA-processing protein DprA [Brachyspira hyodysenteriae]KLI39732.1 DNA processing protein DprA [Brachyspira hyodysenteriae]KLI44379.1 DNA processing protein DprA [Brachyspira hyodysenteriae]KLI52744.1 DNA processing protein DprA [Brachyspira hyodysenteriae]KLI57811.1 DNA processing protein DprA [Brachyspira hyodysenteriae]KLI58016.1 DNA processing protein DprA [Brachyspira hyodysenteriae]